MSSFLLVAFYAALLLIGGLIGFFKAGSLASLLAGGGSALLLTLCSWGMARGCRAAATLAKGVALLLTLFFAVRFFTNYALFPSGVMGAVSLLVALYLIAKREESKGTT